ncbi:MAG: diaminopimelate epimerase [Gammaproteobacteria bacterium]
MSLSFTKMHGLGNDFMVIDATRTPFLLSPQQICRLSNRHTGVGFDQCLIVEESTDPEIDFFYRIFNADGQEVGQCGNGARCLARFVYERGLTRKKNLRVKTKTTILNLQLHSDDSVTVQFTQPNLLPGIIPLKTTQQEIDYSLKIGQKTYTFHAISVGNPHAVLIVNDLETTDVANIGQKISTHSFFPEQTNVGFAQILNPTHMQLRVYERGCGETHACGSGAVAAAAVGHLYHNMNDQILVSLPGGELQIHWPNRAGPIYLRGPATFVYEGRTLLEEA